MDEIRSPYRIRSARRIGYEASAADLHLISVAISRFRELFGTFSSMALLLQLWAIRRQLSVDPDDRIMTVGEVAAYLVVAPETVRKMVRRGELPARAVTVSWQARYDNHPRSTRKEWRFSKKELDAWIRARSRSQGQGS